VQKHLTLTRHTYNPQIVLFSKRTWDRLDAEEKKLIEEAAAEAKTFQRQFSRDQEAKALDQLKAAGMQVVELSPAEIARLREKAQPVVKKHSEGVPEATVKELYAEIEKARGQM
jgi:TRAP-type C4-dicarboxylate transport system substrate-binding protein